MLGLCGRVVGVAGILLMLVLSGVAVGDATLGSPPTRVSIEANAAFVGRSAASSGTTDRGSAGAGEVSEISRVTSIDVGAEPYISAVDSVNGYVYVPDTGGSNVTIINGTSVVGTIDVGATPGLALFDSVNGFVYVPYCVCGASPWGAGVAVIDGASMMTKIPLNGSPTGAAVDTADGFVYIGIENDSGANNAVAVLNGTALAGWVLVPCPGLLAYDSADGEVYAAAGGCGSGIDTVYVISNSTLVTGLPPFSLAVSAIVVDGGDGDVFCVNSTDRAGANVFVVHGTSVVADLTIGYEDIVGKAYIPSYPAYDPQNGYVYLPNGGSSNVSVVNGTTILGSVAVSGLPNAVAVGGGLVYVADAGANNVSILNGTTVMGTIPVGSSPAYALYDPVNHDVYVSNLRSSNVSVIGPAGNRSTTRGGGVGSPSLLGLPDAEAYALLASTSAVAIAAVAIAARRLRRGRNPPDGKAELDRPTP